MPTTYAIIILAPQIYDTLQSLQTSQDEKNLNQYFRNETLVKIKVCYISESTPKIRKEEFIQFFQRLLKTINENDWLVIIYSGTYAKTDRQNQFNSFSFPFNNSSELNQTILGKLLLQQYLINKYKVLLIIDAHHQKNVINFNIYPWKQLQIVAIVAEKTLQVTKQFGLGGLLINTLLKKFSDIEMSLLRINKSEPTIKEIYQEIKNEWINLQVLEEQSQSSSNQSESSDSEEEIEKGSIFLHLCYSQKGKQLIDLKIPF